MDKTTSNQDRVCRECGGQSKIVRKDYLFIECGLNNVLLKDIEVVVCAKCKSVSPRIVQHEDLMRTIAVALIDKPSELSGNEVRFLRTYLGEGSERFAQMLGIDRSHLSRIENGPLTISKQTDRLVRALAWIHDPKLLQKMKQLNRHKTILSRLSEIRPDVASFQVNVGHASNGYTYDLAAA